MVKGSKNLKDLWKKANENKGKGQFDTLDDGRYLTVITEAEVNNSQASGRLQLMLEFKIQEGELEGKTTRTYIGLDSEIGVQICVNTLNRLGLEVEDPSDLEKEIGSLKGKIVKIRLKTKGEYQNVMVEKVIGEDISGSSEESNSNEAVEEPEVEDDDPPKANEGKDKPKGKKVVEEEEEEVVEEVEEEVELKKGMKVVFTLNGKEVEGKVVSIDEDAGKVVVQHKDKKYRVSGEAISIK